jgi:hypothetical protein
MIKQLSLKKTRKRKKLGKENSNLGRTKNVKKAANCFKFFSARLKLTEKNGQKVNEMKSKRKYFTL